MDKVLSALVMHDIKNALALLEIDLEQLNHHEGVPEEGARAYRRCIDLKGRLINFLTVYKFDQTGLEPLLVEVDLAEFLEDVVGASQSAQTGLSHHGHKITVNLDFERMKTGGATPGYANFDENLLELAIESALSNAVRYAHHAVNVWFEQDESGVVFKVYDDGAGVGAENAIEQRKIADQSSSTGLGIALCRAVAKAHGGGAVALENVPGGGTLFSLALKHA